MDVTHNVTLTISVLLVVRVNVHTYICMCVCVMVFSPKGKKANFPLLVSENKKIDQEKMSPCIYKYCEPYGRLKNMFTFFDSRSKLGLVYLDVVDNTLLIFFSQSEWISCYKLGLEPLCI